MIPLYDGPVRGWWLPFHIVVMVACGPERPSFYGPEAGILTFDAAMLASADSGSPPAGDAGGRDDGGGTRDAGPVVPARFPEVPLVHVGHVDFSPLTIVTHNVTQDETGGLEEVYVVVRNDGAVAFCSVVFDVLYFDSAGVQLARIGGTLTGASRQTSSGLQVSCILPGATALGYGNSSYLVDLERVARMDYYYAGSAPASLSVFAVVSYENLEIVAPYGGDTFKAISGTARVVSGSVRNPQVKIFPTNAAGMPLDQLIDIELATYSNGSSRPFTTTATEAPFTTYLMVDEFRNGAFAIVAEPTGADAIAAEEDRLAQEAWLGRRRAAHVLEPID
jgi:hypothetical protein